MGLEIKIEGCHMTQQEQELQSVIKSMAEEQVLFLKNRYKMNPNEIIDLYTGQNLSNATYSDAIRSIMLFNLQNARKHGFLAS
jgi:hypothetical protein